MTGPSVQELWELALSQRWFSGREGRPVGVEYGGWLPSESAEPRMRPAVLVVEFDDGRQERFLIPLLHTSDGELIDATDHGAVLLDLLRTEAPGFERLHTVPTGLAAKRYMGEQSNTSIFYGGQLLAKVFRRLEPGVNTDVEVHRALAGSGVVAELYGAWRVDDTDYAVFLEALKEPEDGYVLASQHAKESRSFAHHARALGQSLATVHRLLAERFPTTEVDGAALAAGFRERFHAVGEEVPAVAAYREAAERVFQQVADTALPAQRVHGDCHLGQVLLSEGRWVYVDFEGEPLKSLEERRAPDSPLRDVAGMLRSFAYAAAAGGADDEWLHACRAAFLDGYGLDAESGGQVLAAYEIDKAGYEVIYEARYRPHLLSVPLGYLDTLS
ncbi:MAG: phosphotransferase [Propionibacteriaceae bacterium]|nr:phosphotransferase [Propionibacteriaceae bacterium]